MEQTPTIRTELDKYLKKEGLNLAQFGQMSGMNRGIISAIVTGNKSMSINQLDRITEAMDLPEGYFYDLFIENYIIDHPPNMRRIEPFLYRCVELEKFDSIRRVVGAIMDNLLYCPKLFEIAENLYSQGQYPAAQILYEGVAEAEKYQHSERLAVCQYRIFMIQIGEDQNRNLRAAILFEPYVERLNEVNQLDALKDLANVYRSLRKWDKVDEVSRKMRAKAEIQYSMKHHDKSREYDEAIRNLSRPMFVYIAYADLLCASVCEAQGDYQRALQYTYAYEELDWVKETDEDTQHWIGLFKHWAKANLIVNTLLSGDINVLQDYVDYIDASVDTTQEDRIIQLLNIMIAANQYNLDVHHIIKRFEKDIASLSQPLVSGDMYTQQVVPDYYAWCGYELAYYYLNQGTYSDGFNLLFCSMVKAHTLNNETYFINCMGLFVRFKSHTVPEVKTKFYNLIEKVWEKNVEKNGHVNRCE
ncbi:transcriptional regulator with XRE-family HTH domain [Paenibacillus sp. 1182]|uniref:tetratricopeptide repeat protein n=1 Tax=Paenibacillus sp. 1182 TaxID=2806565 RepID=UPI001AE98404|nr:helix-turn-helix transcriptional regulator [Paenibacillus sp. 1182]MBP1308729.1 transcriptional regulator with XRE-family HTH domain [Paenibacillus sp. 1182]